MQPKLTAIDLINEQPVMFLSVGDSEKNKSGDILQGVLEKGRDQRWEPWIQLPITSTPEGGSLMVASRCKQNDSVQNL